MDAIKCSNGGDGLKRKEAGGGAAPKSEQAQPVDMMGALAQSIARRRASLAPEEEEAEDWE